LSSDVDFYLDVRDAIADLTIDKPNYDPEEALLGAGKFVARFGSLGDVFDEGDMARNRRWTGPPCGFILLGHWSVQRNDPCDEPDVEFDVHAAGCGVCHFLESVRHLRAGFEDEMCHACGLDLDTHHVVPDPFGNASTVCRSPWERQDPAVAPAGDVTEYQISDAFSARWTAALTDGTYALINRAYYVVQYDGKPVELERLDEYLICRDLADPGGTEINSEYVYVTLESDDPARVNTAWLAELAPDPALDEWATHAPHWSRDLLPIG
jgi:hypothetical protein